MKKQDADPGLYLELKEKLCFTLIMVTHNQNIADMARTIIRVNSGKFTEVVTNDQPQTAYDWMVLFPVKDIRKLVVVSIIGACAVFVANLLEFLPGYRAVGDFENQSHDTDYNAQVSLSWMVAMVSG